MKYPVSFYAKALAAVALEKKAHSAAVAENFLALVRKNGDEIHLRKIINESERLMRRRDGRRAITVATARAAAQSPRALLGNFAKPEDDVRAVIMPDLVAGMKVMVDGETQYDGSMKGKIERMFG